MLGNLILFVAGATASAPVVERIDVQGVSYLPKDTLLFYVSTRAGDRYDEGRLKEDFRRLWDAGFLDDLVLHVLDGSTGKLVVFQVVERKRIQIVDYRGSKVLTGTTVEEALRKKDLAPRVDSFYDPAKARRAEAAIRGLLVEKGHPFGAVTHQAKAVGGAGYQLSFTIDDGPRARVKEIVFTGNQAFSDRALKRRMKKVKESKGGVLGFLTAPLRWGKTTFTEGAWSDAVEGDQGRLTGLYLDHGYVTASVGAPIVSYHDGRSGVLRKRPTKWIRLEIPVVEGEQYRVGRVTFEGLTVFKEDAVRPLFKLAPGDVYRESPLRRAYDKLRDAYGAAGYFQWTGFTRRSPDPERKVVDLVIQMDEDRRYYVGRIRFTGNQATRDKVIRREVYLNEGDVFNTELLKLSIRRINQLGYFKPMEGAPELAPSRDGEDRLDVTIKVEEQNRNQFTLGGGVSGLEGTFLNGSFQTSNFLGLGETFQVSTQVGARARVYQVAVTEPYFLDRPVTAGIDLFSRHVAYPGVESAVAYIQGNTGASFTTGVPLTRFSRLFGSYSYEMIRIYGVNEDELPAGTTTLREGTEHESRLTPSWVRNTVDNPYLPRSGSRWTASVQLVGGPLRGTTSYTRPTIEGVVYRPVGRKTALGLRGEASYIRPFSTTTEIPYYQRVFLGGETQIRGYDVRTVSPVDSGSGARVGGNKYVLLNAEYYFDLFGPLRLLLFFDAGEAYREGQAVNWRTLRTSTGAEARFLMPVLNVPFRLIWALNLNRDLDQPRGVFKFAVGTTF